MAGSGSGNMSIRCECGATLGVNASAIGRQAKCPACGVVFVIEAPDAVLPIGDDSDSLLDDLAAMEQSSEKIEEQGTGNLKTTCPACSTVMAADANICVSCGYDMRTGASHKAVNAKRAAAADATRRLGRRARSFAFGCALSAAGALIGAAIWCVIAIVANYEIGFIACGLGALAGLGMVKGCGEESVKAGVTAAAFAVVGILAAKLMIFLTVNYAELQEAQAAINSISPEDETARSELAAHRTDLEILSRGLHSDDDSRLAIYERESDAIDVLSDEELSSALEEMKAWEAGGKCEDPAFVRKYLISDRAEQLWTESLAADGKDPELEYKAPRRRDWRKVYKTAETEVEEMTPDEQLAGCKQIEADKKLQGEVDRLATQRAVNRLVESKRPLFGSEHDAAFIEEQAVCRALSDEELATALVELDAWEAEGKWQDSVYLRNKLIYAQVDKKVMEAYFENLEASDEEAGDYDEWLDGNWDQVYAEAEAEIARVPEDELLPRAKGIEEEQKRRQDEAYARMRRAASKAFAGDVLSFIVENYFGAMDLLFIAFAVLAAYNIGTGSSETE